MVTDFLRHVDGSNLLFNVHEALYVFFSMHFYHSFLKKATDLLQLKKSFQIAAQRITRWTCRYKNCEQLMKHCDIARVVLRSKIEQRKDTNAIEAINRSFKHNPRDNFIVALFIFFSIITLTHVLSKQLQLLMDCLTYILRNLKGFWTCMVRLLK